jgi:demethylmenaquinone methyltransferase/2-methoxy-6-polyprenyl-1,4-benzoquinol methylase
MSLKHTWMGRDERLAQLDERVSSEKLARFGSEELSEADKEARVRRHFDAVAGKYDVMNTLLSFGTHYWWKHRAVSMLNLKPGGRVLDVSGGTGDLSVMSQRAVGPTGQVVLYDINYAMITAGREKTVQREVPPAHCLHSRRCGENCL